MDHAEKVLSAIVSKENPRRDLLATASVRLGDEHFVNKTHKNIFKFLIRYYDKTGAVLPSEVFTQALTDGGIPAAEVLSYTQAFEALEAAQTNEADFKWSLEELVEQQAKRLTGTALATAFEVLERGYEYKKEFLKGHKDARRYLAGRVAEIEHLAQEENTPEGNVFNEAKEILYDYIDRKTGKTGKGVKTGVKTIDDKIGGLFNGEFHLCVSRPGVGKSQVVTQMAWDAAVNQHLNVFFATSETIRPQVIRRLLARHSLLPQFEWPRGINSESLKHGSLSPEEEKVLQHVLEDWRGNSAYGKLHLIQMPSNATLSYLENRLRHFGQENSCGLLIMDYIALLKAETKRSSTREEQNEILKGCKLLAQSYGDGTGIPFISPWQISRTGEKDQKATGYHTMADLSDTSEAEKSSDGIMAFVRPQENTETMSCQWLKFRDGSLPPTTELSIDFRCSYIGPLAQSMTPFATTTGVSDDILAYLDDN